MSIRQSSPFIVFSVVLALSAPALAQTPPAPPVGVQGGIPGGVPGGVRGVPPMPPMPPMPILPDLPTMIPPMWDVLLPLPPFPPMSIGPIGPGPMGLGPFGEGPRLITRAPMWDEQDRERDQQEREAERKRMQRERELQFFDQGTSAIDEGRYDRAISYFDRVIEIQGTRADGALYWKAFAQNRAGQRAEALSTISELTKRHPNSGYVKQAKALEVEVRARSGQPVRPEDQADDDLKVLAIQSLQNTDPEQAVPLLEKLLQGTASPKVKRQALFVLAQSNSPRAREVVRNIARGGSGPELQSRAIQYIATSGSKESRAILVEIYSSTTDVDVKRRILRAFMQAGEKDRLLNAAQTEQNPELRIEAVRQLGGLGATEELWQLYQKEASVDVKRQMISAMQAGGNATRMIELAKSEKDPSLRRTAIRNLGAMGSKRTGDVLVELYGTEQDPAIRKEIINGLASQGNSTALVAMARKEGDLTMKKEIVQRLANMTNDKVARDYMLELLK